MSDAGARDSKGLWGRTGTVSRRMQVSSNSYTRLRPQPRFSMVPAESLRRRIPRMYRARRRGYRVGLLDTPRPLGRGKRSDKEAKTEV